MRITLLANSVRSGDHELVNSDDQLSLLNDDPITGQPSAPDLLGRTAFARSCADAIDRVAREGHSSVIALIGPWGSGKSSAVNLIRAELQAPGRAPVQKRRWEVSEFNPWYYETLSSLQNGFFNTLTQSLPKDKGKVARSAIGNVLKTVSPLGSLGSIVGVDGQGIVEKVGDLLSPERNVETQKAIAEKALQEAGQPILIVLDDLDRLAPDELLMVFKLIRLTGRLPHVHYLISYDEQTLLDVLTRTGLVGSDGGRRAQDYMEKIVQIRLDLPPLRTYQASSLIDQTLSALARRHDVALEESDLNRFSTAYRLALRDRLDTPRALRRYFGQADVFLTEVKGEVDFVDFLLLTWLRSTEPLTYNLLIKHKSELVGRTTLGTDPLGDVAEAKKRWHELLAGAKVSETHLDGVASVLGLLFGRWSDVWAGRSVRREREQKKGRVANPDYFERFFAFGVPAEDIPDATVAIALDQIGRDIQGTELQIVNGAYLVSPELVLTKIEEQNLSSPIEATPLLLWLIDRHHAAPQSSGLFSPKEQTVALAARLLVEFSPAIQRAMMQDMMTAPHGFELVASVVQMLRVDETRSRAYQPEKELADEEERLARDREFIAYCRTEFDKQGAKSPLDIPDDTWFAIWPWQEIDFIDAVGWVREAIESGRWDVLDALARFVSTSTVIGVDHPQSQISDFSESVVTEAIGLPHIFETLRSQLDQAENPDAFNRVVATPDTRRRYALARLRAMRDSASH